MEDLVEERPYLTLAEVATMLAVDARSVRRWAETDVTFPATRLGPRSVRVERAALDEWLHTKTQRRGRRR